MLSLKEWILFGWVPISLLSFLNNSCGRSILPPYCRIQLASITHFAAPLALAYWQWSSIFGQTRSSEGRKTSKMAQRKIRETKKKTVAFGGILEVYLEMNIRIDVILLKISTMGGCFSNKSLGQDLPTDRKWEIWSQFRERISNWWRSRQFNTTDLKVMLRVCSI